MSDESSSKRRKMSKNYYANQNKPKNYLEPGIRGFLATCGFAEKGCIRECYNLLNEYADQKLSDNNSGAAIESEETQSKALNDDGNRAVAEPPKNDNDEEEKDISDLLEDEIKTIATKRIDHNRFQQVETKIGNCMFIKTTIPNPNELGVRLMRDIAETQQRKTRFLQRLWPVDTVCKANIEDIKNACGKLFDKMFLNTEPTTFSIVVNKRHNNSIDRMAIIKELAELVEFKSSAHKVDLKNPKITIAIEVIKGLCCISLLPDYYKLKKYNIHELTQPKEEEKPASAGNETKDQKSTSETKVDEDGDNSPIDASEDTPVEDAAGSEPADADDQQTNDQ